EVQADGREETPGEDPPEDLLPSALGVGHTYPEGKHPKDPTRRHARGDHQASSQSPSFATQGEASPDRVSGESRIQTDETQGQKGQAEINPHGPFGKEEQKSGRRGAKERKLKEDSGPK